MTIDPKDFSTLLVRLALVTLALRAAAMFTADMGPLEAAAALGLGRDGQVTDWAARLSQAWAVQCGGAAGLVRLPVLVLEVALPLLAVGLARVAGWGSLAGLFIGLALSLGPTSMQSGHQFSWAPAVACSALLSLTLLRGGLRDGDTKRVLASAVVLAGTAMLVAPVLLVVPAGLYLAWRAIAMERIRWIAALTWAGAMVLAVTARVVLLGFVLPEPDMAAAAWLDPGAAEPSHWATAASLAAAQALASASPIGPWGALGRQLDLAATPMWSAAVGLVVLGAAIWGWVAGLVQADPAPLVAQTRPAANDDHQSAVVDDDAAPAAADSGANGVGARHGWRTLGVTLPTVPRELGDRDWAPYVLVLLTVAAFATQASMRAVSDGLAHALAVARVAAAVLVGAGLAALATSKTAAASPADSRVRRRSYLVVGTAAIGLVAAGAWHLLALTTTPERMGPRKVAAFARDAGQESAVIGAGKAVYLGIGPRALPVAAMLDPSGHWPQLRLARGEAGDAATQLIALLYKEPMGVIVFGDADALGSNANASRDQRAVANTIEQTLALAGFAAVPDSHRLLGPTAVAVYSRNRPSDPATIRPQLQPGVAP
ncbi:MAG: hypothetical protein EXR77_02155 [Myxococcales bacterium]|nr:hypothetical protein [Myxococcales bacterium]